jgi:hypothetical protein
LLKIFIPLEGFPVSPVPSPAPVPSVSAIVSLISTGRRLLSL